MIDSYVYNKFISNGRSHLYLNSLIINSTTLNLQTSHIMLYHGEKNLFNTIKHFLNVTLRFEE